MNNVQTPPRAPSPNGRTTLPSAQTMIFAPVASGLDRLVSLSVAPRRRIWPFVAKVPDRTKPSDPINLVFTGTNARGIRAALRSLEAADRPAIHTPPGIAKDAVWTDAMGAVQVAYASDTGWSGGVIQLELGDYLGVRIHLRLFDLGDLTVGNAHIDVRMPGTAEHAVVAWDAAADIVQYELKRAGVLTAAPRVSERITPGPYRTIGKDLLPDLPPDLASWLNIPTSGPAHPLHSRGRALVLQVGATPASRPAVLTREIQVPVDYTLLKPFCRSREDEWVHLVGTLKLSQRVIEGAGRFSTSFTAQGLLEVTPVDPEDRNPAGIPYAARVSERYLGLIDDSGAHASLVKEHSEFLAEGGPGETRAATERLLVEPGHAPEHWVRQRC